MSAVCGDIDITSGDFSMKVNNCYAIENGSISNRIPSFVYYGNALNILKNISDIGNDLIIKSDKCSKKGQLHTVYYGAPTIKINNQKLWS
jgi:predicted Zn-dependent protease